MKPAKDGNLVSEDDHLDGEFARILASKSKELEETNAIYRPYIDIYRKERAPSS